MLMSLMIPVLASAVALFIASFLSWMIAQLHKQDWLRLNNEDEVLKAVDQLGIKPGSYMFPCPSSNQEMQSEEFAKKLADNPNGIITVFPKMGMGPKLGLTFLYFFCCCFCIAYLASIVIEPGAEFMLVFRFVATAGLMTFLAAILQHAIWFHNRVVGHVIECICYALITGAIFGALWPGA